MRKTEANLLRAAERNESIYSLLGLIRFAQGTAEVPRRKNALATCVLLVGVGISIPVWAQCITLDRTLNGHDMRIRAILFSCDGNTLVSGSDDHTVVLWDIASGEKRRTLATNGPVTSLAVSPDGQTLATSSVRDGIRLWDTKSGSLKTLHQMPTNVVWEVFYTSNGMLLAAAKQKETVYLQRVGTSHRPMKLSGHRQEVLSLAFQPSGDLIATGDFHGVVIWDTRTGNKVSLPNPLTGTITSVCFSQDGMELGAGSSDGSIRLCSMPRCTDHHKLVQYGDDTEAVDGLVISPDGKLLAAAIAIGNVGKLELWDIGSQSLVARFPIGNEFAYSKASLCFRSDGKYLASAGKDASVRLWRISPSKQKD